MERIYAKVVEELVGGQGCPDRFPTSVLRIVVVPESATGKMGRKLFVLLFCFCTGG